MLESRDHWQAWAHRGPLGLTFACELAGGGANVKSAPRYPEERQPRLHRAGILFLGERDRFQRFVCTRDRRAQFQRLPLVLRLALGLDGEGICFLHELVIPASEIALASFEDVELRFLFEIGDQLVGFGRFGLVDRLRHDLERGIFDPGMVLRRLAVLFYEALDERL